MISNYETESKRIDKVIHNTERVMNISGIIALALIISVISVVVGCEIGKRIQSKKECVIKIVEP